MIMLNSNENKQTFKLTFNTTIVKHPMPANQKLDIYPSNPSKKVPLRIQYENKPTKNA